MPDTLKSIMAELKSRINTADTKTKVTKAEIDALRSKTVVVLPAGGKGTRIRAETHSEGINKVMISIDGRQSMIERTVMDYVNYGIKEFVVLTGFLADRVEEHLGDGSRWGVRIQYSQDPDGKKVGNAGAILHALNNGTLDDGMTAIIHNPDDLIIGLDRPCGEVFLEGHLRAVKKGGICTFVVVPETPFQYSGMIIREGKVLDVTKYPSIAIPAHTGITIFDPKVYDYFRRLVSLDKESSFESLICPILAVEGFVYAVNIPAETWIPVNDLKGIEFARKALERTRR